MSYVLDGPHQHGVVDDVLRVQLGASVEFLWFVNDKIHY
jgi:hypothetical protein